MPSKLAAGDRLSARPIRLKLTITSYVRITRFLGRSARMGDSVSTSRPSAISVPKTPMVPATAAAQKWAICLSTEVTGPARRRNDQKIVLIIRPASSGTRATFKKIVLGGANEAAGTAVQEDSNGAVTTAVENTPGSTSVIGFAYYQQNLGKLTGLQLDGVDASVANMANGTYKLSAEGHMYTKGAATGLTKAFIDYILSPEVQNGLVKQLFYAPVSAS